MHRLRKYDLDVILESDNQLYNSLNRKNYLSATNLPQDAQVDFSDESCRIFTT